MIFKRAAKINRNLVTHRDLEHALQTKGINSLLDNMESRFREFLRPGVRALLHSVVVASGTAAAKAARSKGSFRGASIAISFNKSNPFARQWAERHAAQLVTNLSKESKKAIREVITRSFDEQISPASAARLIRPLIGLTSRQAEAVMNLRERMINNPGSTIVAGRVRIRIPENGASESMIEDRSEAYADRLLGQRADAIARTETITASNEGQRQLWLQAVDDGLLSGNEQRVWIATPDEKTCPICDDLDGQVVGLDEPFVSSDVGELDGPAAHTDCRCAQGIVAQELPQDEEDSDLAVAVARALSNDCHDEKGQFCDTPGGGGSTTGDSGKGDYETIADKFTTAFPTPPGYALGYPQGEGFNDLSIKDRQNLINKALENGTATQAEVDRYYKAFAAREKERMKDPAYYDASRVQFTDSWRRSSKSFAATQMKFAAQEAYGAKGEVFDSQGVGRSELGVIHSKALLTRMHGDTQAEIGKFFPKGNQLGENWDGKKLTLYRGMKGNKGTAGVLESWTTSRYAAQSFGRVRKKSFGSNQVLTFHLSRTWPGGNHQGFMGEQEYIIIRGL
jgi:hypothetical protein